MHPPGSSVTVSRSEPPANDKPCWAMVLPTLLKHGAGTTVEDGAQKTYKYHVKEPHVALEPLSEYHWSKQYYLETEYFPTHLGTFAESK